VHSYGVFNHSCRKENLARVDDRWRKQRNRLRHCGANRAIWIHTRESILHCPLFLQRVELAQPAGVGFEVVSATGKPSFRELRVPLPSPRIVFGAARGELPNAAESQGFDSSRKTRFACANPILRECQDQNRAACSVAARITTTLSQKYHMQRSLGRDPFHDKHAALYSSQADRSDCCVRG
jgi:hypothetical protein